jgi:hypothetical protein
MDYNIFLRTIKFADYYRTTKTNIYFFIKDCLFQRIFKVYGNRFPSTDCQNLFNIFQMEMKQSQWKRNNISKQEYQQYLEELFKKVDFHTIDYESCEILKALTENIGIFGPFDNLTNERIKYFNKKIQAFKSNPNQVGKNTNIFSLFQHKAHTEVSSHNKNLIPQNTVPNDNNVLDLPDAGTGNKKQKKEDPEMARLNEIMRQQKINSPIYITNVQPGQFYNPYTMPNYIPKGVMTNIPLPMRKTDRNYPSLKAIIDKELILANQELDYHKIDMARNHLERAAYYLKNIID